MPATDISPEILRYAAAAEGPANVRIRELDGEAVRGGATTPGAGAPVSATPGSHVVGLG